MFKNLEKTTKKLAKLISEAKNEKDFLLEELLKKNLETIKLIELTINPD